MSDTVGSLVAVGNSALSAASGVNSMFGGAWFASLQPGSWRGAGFVLDAAETKAGRRVALHEYPYRDDVWPEDLGKLPRRFAITAFVVGDDVYAQRDAMLAACEQAGPGTLVHPTLGAVQCVLLDFSCADRREHGRVVEFQFAFILAGGPLYPNTSTSTGDAVDQAAGGLDTSAMGDLGSTLAGIGPTVQSVVAPVAQFTSAAAGIASDAGQVIGAVRGLSGMFGRYSAGNLLSPLPITATVGSVLAATTTARTAVNSAAALVNSAAALL